jgi:hypothetical protein
MAGVGQVFVRIRDDADLDAEEMALATRRLQAALLELDVLDVGRGDDRIAELPPDGAKGVGAVFGWLWVTIGGEAIKAVVDRVADWAASNGRTVEITVDGKTLKVSKVSREEQRQLIDAYLAQLAAGGGR